MNGMFSGIFHFNGSYGHLGAYKYELSVATASDLRLVDRMGLAPSRPIPTPGRKYVSDNPESCRQYELRRQPGRVATFSFL